LAGSAWVGKNNVASPPRHCRLTVSPASTDVALIILPAVDFAAAALDGILTILRAPRRLQLRTAGAFGDVEKVFQYC
jgi:hypothetical protein